MTTIKQRIQEATEVVQKDWQEVDERSDEAPETIITIGSGLGAIIDDISVVFEMSYEDIPHVAASRMKGHAGRLIIGYMGKDKDQKVVALDGRVHGYEGHDPLTQVLPLLISNQLCGGAKLAILTNAAGAINEFYQTGEIMLIADHINFTGQNVVVLNEETDFGGSNLDMTFVYTPAYRRALESIAYENDIRLYQGVYIAAKGAMFETPAEIIAFRKWGADAVGMSTVHEATAASRLGIDVVGFSVLTNMAAGIEEKRLTHREVLEGSTQAVDTLVFLIESLFEELSEARN